MAQPEERGNSSRLEDASDNGSNHFRGLGSPTERFVTSQTSTFILRQRSDRAAQFLGKCQAGRIGRKEYHSID